MQLTDEQKKRIIAAIVGGLIFIALAVLAALGMEVKIPTAGAAGLDSDVEPAALAGPGAAGYQCNVATTACVVSRYGRDLQVYSDGGSTLKYQVDGATGTVAHSGFERLTAATSITVTNGNPFTPTGTYQRVAAAGAVTPTLATSGFTAGDILMLVNTSAQNILIQDTGNQVLAGNATLAVTLPVASRFQTIALLPDGRVLQLHAINSVAA